LSVSISASGSPACTRSPDVFSHVRTVPCSYEAEADGVLEILVEEGTTVAVGVPIGRLGTAVGDAAEPAPAAAAPEREADAAEPAPAVAAPANGRATNAVAATPLARRAAALHGVSLDGLQGTGPLGRITRADVLGRAGVAVDAPPPAPAPEPSSSPSPEPAPGPATTRQEPTRVQQVIARRMAEAKATVPHFQVQTEVVMDAAIALRGDLKALAADGAPTPSFNDIIIKATAVALREHPLANASYKDGGFELHSAVNIGMAVATDGALIVPTVVDAVGRSLHEIAADTRRLAARVRSGEITARELSGATFTVSNLGMFGMTAITPVINPPQAAILGVGAMRDVLTRRGGEIVDQTLLTLTLSCDHRILYGADASRFLARIRELLETPLRLVL
jgi:pyruvate dehydrogenase E2 component (dihydrolipoamide acetyltransferase)